MTRFYGTDANTIKISNVNQLPSELQTAAAALEAADPLGTGRLTVFDPITGEVRPVFISDPLETETFVTIPGDAVHSYLLVGSGEEDPPPPPPAPDTRLATALANLATAKAALDTAEETFITSGDPADKAAADTAREKYLACSELVSLLRADA